MKKISLLLVSLLFFFSFPLFIKAVGSPDIVINEIAWMGTEVSYNDEWIELYNNTNQTINLDGWRLEAEDGSPKINLAGEIPVNGFFILERTDDNTLPEVLAEQIYTGALENSGENLKLYDSLGNLIDSVDCGSGWFAGNNETKQTMERVRPRSDPENWQTSQNPGGTPKARNSLIKESTEVGPLPAQSKEDLVESGSPLLTQEKIVQERSGEKELAAVGEQIPEEIFSPLPILVALGMAIFSAVIILILKKNLTKSSKNVE